MNSNFSFGGTEINLQDMFLLAESDPVEFERLRTELINRVIDFPGNNSNLLAALQRRLDKTIDTDIQPRYLSLMYLSDWIDESYQQLDEQLNHLRQCI